MSRAVSATANRAGITKDWNSVWFATNADYSKFLLEDYNIRQYLFERLRVANIDSVIIKRQIGSIKIIVKVGKPGIAIGRKGKDLAIVREALQKMTESKLEIIVEEVKRPDTSAKIIADTIAMQLEKRFSPKRALNIAADKAVQQGAKGVKIVIGGTIFGPSSIASVLKTTRGALPTQTLRKDITFAKSTAHTIGGTIGVKVWINNGDIVK